MKRVRACVALAETIVIEEQHLGNVSLSERRHPTAPTSLDVGRPAVQLSRRIVCNVSNLSV